VAERLPFMVGSELQPPFIPCVIVRARRLNGFELLASITLRFSRWGGLDHWCCFEVCNTRGMSKLSFLFRCHISFTVLVRHWTNTKEKNIGDNGL
jgi:hypothetical protein